MVPMAGDIHSKTTLIRAAASSRSGQRTSAWTLPPDLLADAVRRLRSSALLYALAFFLAGFLPPLLSAHGREMLFSMPNYWVPGVASIAGALTVAWIVSLPRLSDRLKMRA